MAACPVAACRIRIVTHFLVELFSSITTVLQIPGLLEISSFTNPICNQWLLVDGGLDGKNRGNRAPLPPIISVKFHHKHTAKVRASSEQPWNKTLKLLIISHLVFVEE